MKCPRCSGLMIVQEYRDLLDDTGQLSFHAWRCVACGEVLDGLILKNRTERPKVTTSGNRNLKAYARR